jgi:hypothetical protein
MLNLVFIATVCCLENLLNLYEYYLKVYPIGLKDMIFEYRSMREIYHTFTLGPLKISQNFSFDKLKRDEQSYGTTSSST